MFYGSEASVIVGKDVTFVVDEQEGEVAVGEQGPAVAKAMVEDGVDKGGLRGRRQEVPELAHEGDAVGQGRITMRFVE